jgi:DNA-binding CsgD family transcriptional regulator
VARLVVGRDLTVLAANRKAESLLEASGTFGLKDDVLAARDRRVAAELAEIVGSAERAPRLSVIGAGGPSALLAEAFAMEADGQGPVAVSLRDLKSRPEIECADLEASFGVTPGEHLVVVQLLKGHASRDIALETGKSILTIRTHVKRAYGKIGVKTRGQLFARLLPYLSIREG